MERDLLKSGFIQVLPYRDAAGRRIAAALGSFGTSNHTSMNKVSSSIRISGSIIVRTGLRPHIHTHSSSNMKRKVLLYMIQAISEDEETQKQGCVFLFWPLEPRCKISKEVNCVIEAAPIRFSSFHFMLLDTTSFRKLGAWQVLAMPVQSRARTRFHFGEQNASD